MGLVYWLPMTTDDLVNQGLSDATPTNNGTTISASGKLGKCRHFSGDAEWIDTEYKQSFGTGDFTLAAWVKLTSNTAKTYQPIMTCKTQASASVGCGIYFNHSQQKFLWSTADGSAATEVWTSNTFKDIYDKWVHVIMVRDSSDTKKGYFYIDGVRKELASVPAIRNVTNTSKGFRLGALTSDVAALRWTGDICDVRIYDNAISPLEAKRLSQGLVLHYTLSAPGENLVLGTSVGTLAAGTSTPQDRGTGRLSGGSGGNGTFSITEDSVPVGKYSYNVLNNASGNRDFQQGDIPFVSGETYTASWWAKGNGTCLFRSWNRTKGSGVLQKTFTLTSDWKYYSYTYTATDVMETDDCTFHLGVTGAASINIAGMKLEKGSRATPWIPAPADAAYATTGLGDNVEYDVSGYGHNGTRVDVTYDTDTPRYLGSSLFEDYTNTIRSELSLKAPTEITMSVWIKGSENGRGGWHQPLNIDAAQFEFSVNSSGVFRSGFYIGGARHLNDHQGGLLDGKWHMLTATYNGEAHKMYVDGELVYTGAVTGALSDTDVLYMGTYGTSTTYGNVNINESDARIYATALSADDILALYRTSASVANNGMVYAYEMVEV